MNAAALDNITRRRTAFRNFAELVGQPAAYRPSLDMRERELVALADAYDAHMMKAGDARRAYRYGVEALQPGQRARVFVNQGERPARVLAVAEGRALVEYDMPGGRSFLWDVPVHTNLEGDGTIYGRRNIAPGRVPFRWRAALAAEPAAAAEPATSRTMIKAGPGGRDAAAREAGEEVAQGAAWDYVGRPATGPAAAKPATMGERLAPGCECGAAARGDFNGCTCY